MTKIFNDPKSCVFSRYLPLRAAGRIRLAHGLIKTIDSLRYRPACGGPTADSSPRWRAAVSSFARCSTPRHPRGPRPRC
jgi:hypothetical protein